MKRSTWLLVGATALGALAMASSGARTANAADTSRSYTSGRFVLNLGGMDAGFLMSVEGGNQTATGPVGAGSVTKEIKQVQYDDIAIRFGNEVSHELYDWMKSSMESGTRKDGSIVALDFQNTPREEREFRRALISEIDLPKLSGASKEPILIGLKITPEMVRTSPSSGAAKVDSAANVKPFLGGNFRLQITGLDDACKRVESVEAMTIKQKVIKNDVGAARISNSGASGAAVSNLIVTLPEMAVKGFMDWQKSTVQGGDRGGSLKAGTLEYLAPDLKKSLFTIAFTGLGLAKLTPDKTEAHGDGIHRVTVEMAVQKVSFSLPPP